MKLVQVLLVNVITVVLALVIYDQVRVSELRPSQERASVQRPNVVDSAGFERRLLALETDRRASTLAEEDDRGVSGEPETSLGEIESTGSPAAADPGTVEPSPDDDGPSIDAAAEWVPDEYDIRRFRRLQEAVRQEKSIEKNRTRVDSALDKLPIRLTKSQRRRIHVAYAAFEPRVGEIWTEVKAEAQATVAAGGTVDRGEIVASTTAVIQSEFAGTLTGIVEHDGDAETIAQALMPSKR